MLEARVMVSTWGWMSYSLIVEGCILGSRRYCLLLSGIEGFRRLELLEGLGC